MLCVCGGVTWFGLTSFNAVGVEKSGGDGLFFFFYSSGVRSRKKKIGKKFVISKKTTKANIFILELILIV